MSRVRALAEAMWSGDGDAHPFEPLLELVEVADGVAFFSGFADIGVVRTGEGLVLVDAGTWMLGPQAHTVIRSWSPAPLHTAVFTHGHVDHVMGLGPFLEERRGTPRVVAHEAVPARFARYLKTRGYNACINARQFGIPVEWPDAFPAVDVTFRHRLGLDVGGAHVALEHARGETDDHAFAFVPDRRVLFTGDLFIWACPNAGNPQKVQRYPDEWAAALRRMELLNAEVLCPGHGPPIFGRDRVRQALSDTAALLESLVSQTLALLNRGEPLDVILGEVRAPAHLLARPWLRPVYDEPEFIVRNLVRLYGGWWDGDPANLKPARAADLARELATLSGGAARLAARAAELSARGDHALACHLAETAATAEPGDESIAAIRRDVYLARARVETSLMAKGVYRSAAGTAR